jgi:hypothetical protein
MNSNELREKAVELMGRALDDVSQDKVLDDPSLEMLVERIDEIMLLILANGFKLPTDVRGFIWDGKPLTPLQDFSDVSRLLDSFCRLT